MKGQEYIFKSIKLSKDKDSIYYNIGYFYLVNSTKKVYGLNTSNNLGVMTWTNKKEIEKALNYFKLIENKTNTVSYRIFECECRIGNEEKVIKTGLKLLEEGIFEDTIYMEMGFKYYDLGYKLINKYTEESNKKSMNILVNLLSSWNSS